MGIETAAFSTAIGAVAPAIQVAGAGLSAVTAYSNSRSTRSAYEAQAQVARNNAVIAGWQADDVLARGDRAVSVQRSKTRQLKGAQRAAMAANGVDLNQGSALNILSDTELFGEMDADTIANNAAKEAWAIRNQANGFTYEAAQASARAANESPLMATAGSLLTSAGKVAGRWYTGAAPSGRDPYGPPPFFPEGQGDRRKIGVS